MAFVLRPSCRGLSRCLVLADFLAGPTLARPHPLPHYPGPSQPCLSQPDGSPPCHGSARATRPASVVRRPPQCRPVGLHHR